MSHFDSVIKTNSNNDYITSQKSVDSGLQHALTKTGSGKVFNFRRYQTNSFMLWRRSEILTKASINSNIISSGGFLTFSLPKINNACSRILSWI